MQNSGGRRAERAKEDKEGLHNFNTALHDTAEAIKKLESKMSYLPMIDANGNSDCPFAEELYAQKEEAEQKVVREVDCLRHFLPLLDQQIARCRSNQSQVQSYAEKLAGPDVKNRYAAAKEILERQYIEATQDRKEALFVLDKAKLALERSRQRQWPGEAPQRRWFNPDSSAAAPFSHKHI